MKKNLVVIGCIWLFITGAANAFGGQGKGEKPVSPLTRGSRPRAAAASGEGFWDDRFFETDGSVKAIVINNGILYAAGQFTCIGGIAANSVAKWDGTTWSALGSGLYGPVYTLAVSGTDLYAGVSVGTMPGPDIYKWDGTTWSAIHSGATHYMVLGLAVAGTDLYAGGGYFGQVPYNFIIKWDGTTWSALGDMGSGSVYALAVSGTDLYVGGGFSAVGGVSANSVAKWGGTTWSALGSGISGSVSALAVSGTDLYVGGSFTTAGGVSANSVAKWDGTIWSVLGSGMNGSISALAVSGPDLYAGGHFTTAGGVSANYIAKWDGTAWSALDSGMESSDAVNVSALAVSGPDLYVGGAFTKAGGVSAENIAKWNNNTWSAMGRTNGLGMKGIVDALAVSGNNLYVGGDFYTAGGVSANRIAKWDGTTWAALGSGISGGGVYALVVSGTDLYVGGNFTTAGGVSANSVAKWDGTTWAALGSGISGAVYALAVSGNNLYVGGGFYTAGGVSANRIAKWDGTTWSALGSGISGYGVYALAVSGTDLYVGGDFTTAGGVSANSIANWDGTTWSALGSGLDGAVHALAVSGTDLFAGGYFTAAGGVSAENIAKWNGTTWSALDSGMDHGVSALTVSGKYLYAGGYFTTAGGVSANHIAKWNGTTWSALGSGMNGNDGALAVSGTDICAGGDFKLAGGVSSSCFAIWHWNLVLTSPVGGEVWEVGTTHPITWAAQPTVGDVKLEYSMDGGTNWTTIAASTPNGGRYDWVVPNSPSTVCLVRISENVNGGPTDASDAVFLIVSQPTIILISPKGGERWYSGSSHNIAWASSLNGGNVKLEYSTDNGTNYTTIIASTANTGSYAWMVPNAASTTCLVRISEASSGSPSDTSDAGFTISPLPPAISLNRTTLYYGAIIDGVATRTQTAMISNTGGGTLGWSASKNKPWIGVSPVSGTGDAELTVTVNPSGLARGTYTGKVTITAPGATNSPWSVLVTLKVYAVGASAAPFGFFETPVGGSTVMGSIPVSGWALDDIEVTKVEVRRGPVTGDPPGAIGADGLIYVGDATFVEGARPDVEAAKPSYPLNYRAGWGYMLLTYGLPDHGNGTFLLHAVALDRAGHRSELGTKTIISDNAHNDKPFGAIDTPGQGATVSGNSYVNFGWVLTPPPAMVPIDGSTIWLWIDSVQVGHPTYNQFRPDVHDAYPDYLNADGAVGYYYLDTTAYADGMHTIGWSATDDHGQAEGMGSRFFWVFNGSSGAGAAALDTRNGSLVDLAGIPADVMSPIYLRTGFRDAGTYEVANPDAHGIRSVTIEETDRVVMALDSPDGLPSEGHEERGKRASNRDSVELAGAVRWSGYLVVGNELRPLPIGSTLDARRGVFYWQPGPGFIGEHRFVFVDGRTGLKKSVAMTIKPRSFLRRR